MIIQLHTPIPLETPKGAAFAHLVVDYGQETHLHWVCFINATGECWTFQNPDVRIESNITMNRIYKKKEIL